MEPTIANPETNTNINPNLNSQPNDVKEKSPKTLTIVLGITTVILLITTLIGAGYFGYTLVRGPKTVEVIKEVKVPVESTNPSNNMGQAFDLSKVQNGVGFTYFSSCNVSADMPQTNLTMTQGSEEMRNWYYTFGKNIYKNDKTNPLQTYKLHDYEITMIYKTMSEGGSGMVPGYISVKCADNTQTKYTTETFTTKFINTKKADDEIIKKQDAEAASTLKTTYTDKGEVNMLGVKMRQVDVKGAYVMDGNTNFTVYTYANSKYYYIFEYKSNSGIKADQTATKNLVDTIKIY